MSRKPPPSRRHGTRSNTGRSGRSHGTPSSRGSSSPNKRRTSPRAADARTKRRRTHASSKAAATSNHAKGKARTTGSKAAKPSPMSRRNVKTRRTTVTQPRFGIGQPRPRMWILIAILGGVLAAVLVQVVRLQTSDGGSYRVEAAEQWSRHRTLAADRGSIFDRNGEELAVSIPAYDISVNPKIIDDPAAVTQLITDTLGLSDVESAELLGVIQAKQTGFWYVERQVDAAAGERLADRRDELGYQGINVDSADERILPGGDTALSVVGKTDIDGNGVSGLELQYGAGASDDNGDSDYADILTGTPGESTRQVGQDGQSIAGTEQILSQPIAGNDVVLTLDRSIQFAVEQALIERVATVQAKAGQVIVMDTDTGDVLSMASVLNERETNQPYVTSRNSAVVDAYEPGSVAKVITIAAALNEGSVKPSSTFVVPWRQKYADDWLHDSHEHPDEKMTVEQILVESSNIGTIEVKEDIAPGEQARRIHWEYQRSFGLGEQSALDFPGESPGILKDWDELWGSERATVAYGQGMASTAIQMVSAINTIANDGTFVAPRLVRSTVDPDGTVVDAPASATHEVVGAEVAKQVQSMMRQVVCRGTARRTLSDIDTFAIAGKTGTGLKAQPNGTYRNEAGERAYFSSFVGFFPAEQPEVTILISIDEPNPELTDEDGTALRFGGTAAAPLFPEIMPAIAHELNIIPPANTAPCPSE